MKDLFLRFPEMNSRRKSDFFMKPRLWLLVHLGVPVLLGCSLFFAAPLRINTLFMDMLPQSGSQSGAAAADRIQGEKSSREAVILAASPDFEIAKKAEVLFYNEFKNSPDIEALYLYFDHSVIAEFAEYLYKYRFVIAGRHTLNLLETGQANEIALDALAAAYGAFTFIPLDNINTDPFLLAERRIEEFLSSSLLSGGNLNLKDDMLAANIDDTWHVLLRMTLTPQALSLRGGNNVVKEIYAAASSLKDTVPELDFYFF